MWEEAYSAGFKVGVMETSDSCDNQLNDFDSGYTLGYSNATRKKPNLYSDKWHVAVGHGSCECFASLDAGSAKAKDISPRLIPMIAVTENSR